MSVSLAQFVGCGGSSFKQVQIPGLGLFWYKNFGKVQNKPLFVGWGWGLLSGAVCKITSSVLFCSDPTWLEVCRAVVRELFYSQKRLIIISFVTQPRDPFFVGGG